MNARSLIKYVRLVDLNENWAMVSNPYEDDLKDVAGLHLKIFPHSLIIFRLHTTHTILQRQTVTHKHTHAHTHSLDKGSNHTQRQYYVTHPHIVWSGRFEYPLTGWIIRKNFTGLQ